VNEERPLRVAYLCSKFPGISHTFILREVEGVIGEGVDVRVFSIRRPTRGELTGDKARCWFTKTSYVLPPKCGRLLSSHAGLAVRHPARYFSVLAYALRMHLRGLRGKFRMLCYFGEAVYLAECFRRGGIDHVHVHSASQTAMPAMLVKALTGIPLSITVHGPGEFLNDELLYEKFTAADKLVAISEFCRGEILSRAPDMAPEKITIVHCGVDPQQFTPARERAPGAFRLLTIGRLVPQKDHVTLVEACAALRRRGLDFRCHIVGDGPTAYEVADAIRRHGLGEHVIMEGVVTDERILELLRGADVFVMSSLLEGVPSVLMEAMSCEVPVVSTRVCGVPELVEDGVSGLLVDPKDPEAIAEAVLKLANGPELRRRLGQAGRRKVMEEFNSAVNCRRVAGLFRAWHGWHALAGGAVKRGGRRPIPQGRRYVLITPARDEAEHLQATVNAVLRQTVAPAKWVIVDDGSTDATPEIARRAAQQHPWIHVIRREDRRRRAVGPGVVDAFYAGYATVDPAEFDYVCKFDADIEVPPGYFEELMRRMEANPRIGTCSGKPYFRTRGGKLVSEACGDETSVGMTKFYRIECFRQIGGFVRGLMWDGIDCHRCRMLGWIACSWDDPELRFVHLRPMGASQRGVLTGRARHGSGQYYMGTGPAYMAASALFRMTRRPVVIGGAAMWWGYVRSMLRRAPRYGDREFRRFLRRFQRDCLLRGKRAATRRLDARQAAQWRPLRESCSSMREHN